MNSGDNVIAPLLMKLDEADPYIIGAVMVLIAECEIAEDSEFPPRFKSRSVFADGDHGQLLSRLEKEGYLVLDDVGAHTTIKFDYLAASLQSIVADVGGRIYHRQRARERRGSAARSS